MPTNHLSDVEFDTKFKKVFDGTDPLAHPGQGIIVDERDKLIIPKENWDDDYAVGGDHVKDSRSPTQTAKKTRSRIVAEPILNHFIKVNVKNNVLISDDKKIDWGIHIDSTVRHVIGEGPHSHPDSFTRDTNTSLHVIIHSKANTSPTKKALPDDVDRCDAFVYIFMNPPGDPPVPTPEPTSEGQFIKRAETTDDKMDIPFTMAEKGKRCKISLQYFNKKGHGPSSEIIEVIIP